MNNPALQSQDAAQLQATSQAPMPDMMAMQMGMMQPQPPAPEQQQGAPDSLSRRLESVNIAEDLDEDKLVEVGVS